MLTTRCHLLLLLLLALLFVSFHHGTPTSPAASSEADANEAAHDALAQFGLPRGLLPGNVASYTKSADGSFTVELSEPCYVQFSDLTYYDKTIEGKITYGAISGLSGIQVRKFFVWFTITRIALDKADGTILFDTGYISEKHPASEFNDIRTCRKASLVAAA